MSKNYFDQFSIPYLCIYISIYLIVDFILQKNEATINLQVFVRKSEYYKNVLWLTISTKYIDHDNHFDCSQYPIHYKNTKGSSAITGVVCQLCQLN